MMKTNRHGKHHPDKVQFGGVVWPEFKAVARLVAEKRGCSITDIIRRGVEDLATSDGILWNGEVTPEYREEAMRIAKSIRMAANGRREKLETQSREASSCARQGSVLRGGK